MRTPAQVIQLPLCPKGRLGAEVGVLRYFEKCLKIPGKFGPVGPFFLDA